METDYKQVLRGRIADLMDYEKGLDEMVGHLDEGEEVCGAEIQCNVASTINMIKALGLIEIYNQSFPGDSDMQGLESDLKKRIGEDESVIIRTLKHLHKID